MSEFIELTSENGVKIMVNMEEVFYFHVHNDGTILKFSAPDKPENGYVRLYVAENYETVKSLLASARSK